MGWSMTKPKRTRLIAERKARKLSQKQLAALVGCSISLISHLEVGRSTPSADISAKLEKVLETPFFELFPDL